QKLNGLTCSDHQHENCIFDELSIWELYLGMHVRLHFTWLTLMILWRFGRFMSLADGVDCPENMLGCVTFFYTFEAFWRIWHASMNRFMLRYLYVPVGGKKRSWLAVPMVFGFVAYWHESTGFLTRPAWYAWGFLNAFGVTAEKALATTVGRQLAKGEADGSWLACILVFLGKGVGPIFLILVNVPAIFYENSWKFYMSFFNRGWETVVLLWTLVLTFGCTAVLVDAFREEETTPQRAPLTSARRVPEDLAELAPGQQKGSHMLLATYESTACCLWDVRSPRQPLFSCYAGDPQSPAICSAVLWRKAWVACAGGRISQIRLRADGLEVARSVRAAPTPYGQPLEQPVYKDDKQGVNAFAVRPDLRLVAAARWDRRVELFDAKTATSLGRLACHDGGVLCVSFDRQRGALAAGGEDGRIAVWGLFSETYEGPFSSAAAQVLGQQSQEKPPAEGWLLLVAAVCSTSGQTTDVSTKPSKSRLGGRRSKVAHGRDGDHTTFRFLAVCELRI
ncbi:GUP1, partial [Symbiodinium necroappetens]